MISAPLRAAIRNSPLAVEEIARRAGVSGSMLSRFLAGSDLRLTTAEKVGAVLGMKPVHFRHRVTAYRPPA